MLEIQNLCYSINQNSEEKTILKNINLKVENNEFLAITGHNGSGKSTLLKIIMGILKPTSGKIIFNGKDITNLNITERANLGLAYAFQTPVNFKGLTVQKMLEIASKENQIKLNDYCNILSKLGMCAREYLNREFNNKLSGGEQKRIEIASVLARNAKLNLFDEPEAGIDIWSFENIIEILKNNKSINVVVSHQKKLMERADKILVLENGTIKLHGKTAEIIKLIDEKTACQKLQTV